MRRHFWSDKETGLVECLRRADEEISSAQQENSRLLDLINVAENKTRVRLLYEVGKERTNSKELKIHNSVDKNPKGGKEYWKSFELESQRSKNTKQE